MIMQMLRFTFKNEAIWMIFFAFGPVALAIVAYLLSYFLKLLV